MRPGKVTDRRVANPRRTSGSRRPGLPEVRIVGTPDQKESR